MYAFGFRPNTLTVISTATDTATASVPLGGTPFSAAVTPDGHTVYIATAGAGTITATITSLLISCW